MDSCFTRKSSLHFSSSLIRLFLFHLSMLERPNHFKMLFTMPDGVSILHCCFVKLSFIPKKIKLSLSGKMWATVAKQTGGH